MMDISKKKLNISVGQTAPYAKSKDKQQTWNDYFDSTGIYKGILQIKNKREVGTKTKQKQKQK